MVWGKTERERENKHHQAKAQRFSSGCLRRQPWAHRQAGQQAAQTGSKHSQTTKARERNFHLPAGTAEEEILAEEHLAEVGSIQEEHRPEERRST